ncbi:MAG: phosphoserine phosphatase RsbU/P [Clostridiales bacterium]|jgi:serine phosphatase RsbU (regulator of sigma subunit)|nr:phosphoserine phosphatase RsbU/P [Clostridiales bacterium]MDN5298724.1 phosphoserine phosphatase RsbU/P [Clostridiales bacterium]
MFRRGEHNYQLYTRTFVLLCLVLILDIVIRHHIDTLTGYYFSGLIFAIMVAGIFYGGTLYFKRHLMTRWQQREVGLVFIGFIGNYILAVFNLVYHRFEIVPLTNYYLAYANLFIGMIVFFSLGKWQSDSWEAMLQKKHKVVFWILAGCEIIMWQMIKWSWLHYGATVSFVDIVGAALLVAVLLNYFARHYRQQLDVGVVVPLTYLSIAQFYLSIADRENVFMHLHPYWLMLLGVVLLVIYQVREIKVVLSDHNTAMYRQFNVYSQNLRKLIDKKTVQIREANQSIINELEYARVIQQSLLPPRKYTYRDVTLVSDYYPCERLSGDFFDVFRIDDEFIALYYMDVAGHGISAALLTMLSNNFLRAQDHQLKRLWAQRPDKSLKFFYDHFNSLSLPEEMHLVIFYATYNLTTKVLTYCSGGMNCAPVVFRKNGNYEILDQSDGFPICMMGNVFSPVFASANVLLRPGDRVVFYTDGLTDKDKNKIFNDEELIAFCRQHRKKSIRDFNAVLTEKIAPNKDDLNDDITYIIMDI